MNSEKHIQSTQNKNDQHRLSRQQNNTKKNPRASSVCDKQRKRLVRTSSLSERQKLLKSSFSSTDSECDVASGSNVKLVPKNEHLMASLPTITLQRAFEPEELLTDSCNASKHRLLPEQEILFLPKEQPIAVGYDITNRDSKDVHHFRGGKHRLSITDIPNYSM